MEVIRVWSFPFFVVVWLVSKTEAVCTSNTPIMENHECCCFPQKHFVKIIHLHWTRNNHMTLSITRNLGVFTQRKEGGYQVLGLHRKNAECGLEHWCLWAQTVDLEVAEPSEQWPGGGWEADTQNTETTSNIFWAGHFSSFLFEFSLLNIPSICHPVEGEAFPLKVSWGSRCPTCSLLHSSLSKVPSWPRTRTSAHL